MLENPALIINERTTKMNYRSLDRKDKYVTGREKDFANDRIRFILFPNHLPYALTTLKNVMPELVVASG
jgi:hypothetical protein